MQSEPINKITNPFDKPVCDLVRVRHCVKLALCQGWGHKSEQGQLFVFEELKDILPSSRQIADN